jgi:hypothetical protein
MAQRRIADMGHMQGVTVYRNSGILSGLAFDKILSRLLVLLRPTGADLW